MLWQMRLFVRYKVISRTTINKEHFTSAWNKIRKICDAEEQQRIKMIETNHFQSNKLSFGIKPKCQNIQCMLFHLKLLKERDILSSLCVWSWVEHRLFSVKVYIYQINQKKGGKIKVDTRSIWHRYKSEGSITIPIWILLALSTLPMNHCDDCKNEISIKENGNVRSIHFIFGVKHSLIFVLICTWILYYNFYYVKSNMDLKEKSNWKNIHFIFGAENIPVLDAISRNCYHVTWQLWMAGKFGKTEFMCNMTYYGNTCEIPPRYLYVTYWSVSRLGTLLFEYKYHTKPTEKYSGCIPVQTAIYCYLTVSTLGSQQSTQKEFLFRKLQYQN